MPTIFNSVQTRAAFLFVAVGLFPFALTAQVGQSPYNPPEFYDRIRQTRERSIADGRANIDLTKHPRYRTVVTDGDDRITVERLPYTFSVNKQTGIVDRLQLLDVVAKEGCRFGDLEIVDAAGVRYVQHAAKNASCEIKEEPTYLHWKVRFSPTSSTGHTLGVTVEARYQLFKLSGLVTVHHEVVEGSAAVRQLVVRNSPGRLPSTTLDLAHSAFFLDNDGLFNDTLSVEVSNTEDGVVASGKIIAPMWTDGRVGFSATALRPTWTQTGALDAGSPFRRTVIATRSEHRAIDFYFVNSHMSERIETGRTFSTGFAFLPFQRYQPRLPLVDGTIILPAQYDYLRDATPEAERVIIDDFRDSFWSGAIFTGTGLAGAAWTPLMYAVTKEPYRTRTAHILALGRQSERVLGTAHCIVNNFPGIPGYGPHPGDEKGAALPQFHAARKRDGFTTLSTAEIRDFWLDVRVSTLEVQDVDADYEDLHAHIDVGGTFASQVEGETRYLEDIALLHEAYGRDKLIIAHAGNILTVADGMNGATWPGEPWTGQNFKDIPRAILDTLLNPFLIGVDVSLYGMHHIYDLGSLRLCKALLRNAVVPQYVAVKSPAAEQNWQRYFLPGRAFRTDRSKFISWRDPAHREYCHTDDPSDTINLYWRKSEAYVTCVNLDRAEITPRFHLNVRALGFVGDEAFVFDILRRHLDVVTVRDGWIEHKSKHPTTEPILLSLRDKPNDRPRVIWSHFGIRFDEKTRTEKPDPAMPAATWTCAFPVFPRAAREERVWMYVGARGRPRSLQPFGRVYVDELHEEQKSVDLIFKVPAATADGPMGGEVEFTLNWNKSFQLSFPVIGDTR